MALAAMSLTSTISSASLVDLNTYSTDTVTGLDWLDVTASAGLSYAAVQGGAGGWLAAGWRYASWGQVADLFSRTIGNGPEYWYADSAFTNGLALIRQLGVSISFNNTEGIQQFFGTADPTQISVDGYFDDGAQNGTVGIAEVVAQWSGGNPAVSTRWVDYPDFWAWPSVSAGAGYGSFLVRDSVSSVPEGQTLPLALLAGLLAAFASSGGKRRAGR